MEINVNYDVVVPHFGEYMENITRSKIIYLSSCLNNLHFMYGCLIYVQKYVGVWQDFFSKHFC